MIYLNNAQYIINDKIEISADDKKLIDDLSKKIINEILLMNIKNFPHYLEKL